MQPEMQKHKSHMDFEQLFSLLLQHPSLKCQPITLPDSHEHEGMLAQLPGADGNTFGLYREKQGNTVLSRPQATWLQVLENHLTEKHGTHLFVTGKIFFRKVDYDM